MEKLLERPELARHFVANTAKQTVNSAVNSSDDSNVGIGAEQREHLKATFGALLQQQVATTAV